MKYIYKCYIQNIDNNIELLHPNNANKIKIVKIVELWCPGVSVERASFGDWHDCPGVGDSARYEPTVPFFV